MMRDGAAVNVCESESGVMDPSDATPIWHQPVMTAEALSYLRPSSRAVIVDGTVGTAGHSMTIAPRLLPDGALICLDRDHDALHLARQRLTEFQPHVTFVHENYRRLPAVLRQLGRERVDGILLDLGMSTFQVDTPERGFSFLHEGPLDMRMDQGQATTAETLVNTLPADDLVQVMETLGEERFARRIAQRIVQERRVHLLTTTTQLARLVAQAVPAGARHGRLHPATRTFQALRMAVNDELGALETFLAELPSLLVPQGRAVVITFHSLEDRMVKRAFVQGKERGEWAVLTKKCVRPSDEECQRNPRARSAKLRAVERA